MLNLSRAVIFSLLLPILPAQAVNSPNIVINEIAWMGTKISSNDEWIELYNNTGSPLSLEGWLLKSSDGTPNINLSGTILQNSFYLLERTDDQTIPGVLADQIYAGALGNLGESLELYDNLGNLIDSVHCSSTWFAGDNSTKQTMERKTDGGWQISQNPGGTPKDKNSTVVAETPKPAEVGPLSNYPSGIVINELLPSPEGTDAQEEWIEIFNQNNSEIDLSNWKIIDVRGAIKIYIFAEGTKIGPKSFLVLPRPVTKITLNNDSDGLKLIQPNGNVLDIITYEKAPRGESFNRVESGWAWSTILTPGSANIMPSPTLENKTEESASSKELAAAVLQIPESARSLYVFLISFVLAICSGAVIFLLKRLIFSKK